VLTRALHPDKRDEISRLLIECGHDIKKFALPQENSGKRRIRLFYPDLSVIKNDIFFNAQLSGILTVASENQCEVSIVPLERKHDGKINANDLAGCDGVIIINPRDDESFLSDIIQSQTPYVIMGRPASHRRSVNYVDADNVAIAYNATMYLLKHGHRAIAFMTGPNVFTVNVDRMEGYKMALNTWGIPYDKELTLVAEYTMDSAHSTMKDFLEKDKRFTAIIANADMLALGVVNALTAFEKHIPNDVSVLCGSETSFTVSCTPPITGMDLNGYELGAQTMRLLIDIMDKLLIKTTHIHVPFTLIERSTVRSITT